jgi:F0F1-type ATP synthase alpha subunit
MNQNEFLIKKIEEQLANFKPEASTYQVGKVISVGDGVAKAVGLHDVMSFEMVEFGKGVYGIALNLEEEEVGIVIVGDASSVSEGDEVKCTGRLLEIPVHGQDLLLLHHSGLSAHDHSDLLLDQKIKNGISACRRCKQSGRG